MSTPTYDDMVAKLESLGQSHLLHFFDDLSPDRQERLIREVDEIDFELIRRLSQPGSDGDEDFSALAARATSPPAFRLGQQMDRGVTLQDALQAGEDDLRAGRVGAVLVAGGQGTRLGFPHPKGMFPLGPVSGRTLFQMHVDQLRAVAKHYGAPCPLYLMTSPATHEETVRYFEQHDRLGLGAEELRVFCQGTMPAVDDEGRVLLADRDQVAMSPDGHGGMLAAFARSGCLKDAQQRGIERLFYFQVDNPLVSIADPVLLGYHRLAASEMTTLVVAKQSPTDKVGNVVSVDDRLMVIEYSDLPEEAANRRDEAGKLVFWAGSIAVHVFDVEFLARAAASDSSLPFHRARKKVPYVNAQGTMVEPDTPNATKFEKFIFDLMPDAHNAIVVEGDERECFAPVKNATGQPKDTPETSQRAIVARAKRWLKACGIEVADGVTVEISPERALRADQLQCDTNVSGPIVQDSYLK